MPIYRFYRLRWTDAWYERSEPERRALLRKVLDARERVGGHNIVDCDSSWATEAWHFFGIEEYPSVDAIREYQRRLAAIGWHLYADSETMLGTCLEDRPGTWLAFR